MRIKKISPTTPANGNIENQYGTSQTNAYSEAYANTTFATKDVATTSANGLMSSTDKTKLNGLTYYRLFTGSQDSGTLNLSDNVDNYDFLIFTSGSPQFGTYLCSVFAPYNENFFTAGTNKVQVSDGLTGISFDSNNKNKISISGTSTQPFRNVYGVKL